jgi:hypothetical protein
MFYLSKCFFVYNLFEVTSLEIDIECLPNEHYYGDIFKLLYFEMFH